MARFNMRLLLALSVALLLLSRPAMRVAAAEEDDDLDDEDYGEEEAAEDGEGLPAEEVFDAQEIEEPEPAALDEIEIPDGDDGDVIALTNETYAMAGYKSKYVLIEYYAPWCGHCKALAPEYKAAAAELKEFGVTLAKLNADKYEEVAKKLQLQGFPTLQWWAHSRMEWYTAGLRGQDIVQWVKKKMGLGVTTISTVEEANKVVQESSAAVVAYFKRIKGGDALVYAEAAKDVESMPVFQTDSVEVAKAFGFPLTAKAEIAVVKQDDEKFVLFDGDITAEDVSKWANANRLPVVITYREETSELVFGGTFKKQVFLFWPTEVHDHMIQTVKPVALQHKDKILFVYINQSEETAAQIGEYIGVSPGATKVIGFSTVNRQDGEKYSLDMELTAENLKAFVEDLLADKAVPFFKSEPIPEKNDEPVTVVVGDTFESIVKDPTKDVLLEIYAPWCSHCKSLEPKYNKLAKKLADVDSVVIAKMDGTLNEHSELSIEGFPTLLFYPANNKTAVTVEVEHKVKPLLKFIKEHASIPFEITKSPEVEGKDVKIEGASLGRKDEL